MIKLFEFKETRISGLKEILAFHADDNRGGFTKDYSKEIFEQNGIRHDLQEVFYAQNYTGVIRGLHFQRVKQQTKLVRCIVGHVWDVVVDLRKDSPNFKKWLGFDLIDKEYNALLVPPGCAHGYIALQPSIVSYQCNEKFYGEYDDGIQWNDKDIAIEWPLDLIGGAENVILSDKDKNLQTFQHFMDIYGGF